MTAPERRREAADVVVVGGGPAGMSAAVEAARTGASVAVVEAREEIGGNGARSTGYVALLGTPQQREAGVEDSVDAFVSDALRAVERARERYGVIFDEGLLRSFLAATPETYRFLAELGFRFNRLVPRRAEHSVDRLLDVADVTMFRTLFERAAGELGIRLLLRSRVERLLAEEGRVLGVIAAADGDAGGLELRARGGVVLAAGGYQASPEMRLHYQPEFLARTPYLGVDSDRGDGHRLGQSVGGELINMTLIPPLVMVASALVEDSIAVNKEGRRFHDEAGAYDGRVDALLAQPERRAYYICDGATASARAALIAQMSEAIRAESLGALASAAGIDGPGLESAVVEWNRLLESGADRDPEFGRVVLPRDRRGIRQPPFLALPMRLGVNFPGGGFRTTAEMQVVSVLGEPIPGLYAAGECAGGVSPSYALPGMHLAGAVTLGRVAGRAAARA